MILKTFILGPIEDNNYLLIDEDSKEAVLIDSTEQNEQIDTTLKENNATLKYVLLTHGHFDHILGANYYRDKYGAKVLLHQGDKEMIDNVEEFAKRSNFLSYIGASAVAVQNVDTYINDGEIIKFGQNEIKVIHTPGHTKGGVCFLVGDKIFTGDTLFYLSVGRTDLPGGSFDELKTSIEEKLFILDKNLKVYPGHGITSTIGYEKENNKFL